MSDPGDDDADAGSSSTVTVTRKPPPALIDVSELQHMHEDMR